MTTKLKTAIALALVLACPVMTFGRIKPVLSYQTLHKEADLVVIAKPIATTSTSEKTALTNISPNVPVVGVQTEFAVRVVMKGEAAIQKFTVHHYAFANAVDGRNRGAPALVSFDAKQPQCYLLFLKKEADGRFAPMSGQTDPGDSIIRLESDSQ